MPPKGASEEFSRRSYQATADRYHATVGYNQGSGFATGSCMVALLLTKESVGWQHHHGSYSKSRSLAREAAAQYKTIMFGTPAAETDNAIVVHETPLLLQLGHARAFDPKEGWVGYKCHEEDED